MLLLLLLPLLLLDLAISDSCSAYKALDATTLLH
jgi:hypothetical protein